MKRIIVRLLLISICFGVAQAQSQSESVLIDEFQSADCDDIWARLDNYLIQLNNHPASTGIIVIEGKLGDFVKDLYYEAMIRGYFAKRLGPHSPRWKILRAPQTQERRIRFWLMRVGDQPPKVDNTEWSLRYPSDSKPFIFTQGDPYSVEISVCLYVDELRLLANVLEANPTAKTNIVLKVRSQREFITRKRKTLLMLRNEYSIAAERIRFFKQVSRKPNPYGIDRNVEYWFVP